MAQKPWVEGSIEVLELAIEQYYMSLLSKSKKESARYLRSSLINGDDAVELGAKAYIEYVCGEKEKGNFYENLKWIRQKGDFKDKTYFKQVEEALRFYHKQRNTLYHEGYSPPMSKLQVLNLIANCITFFRIIFAYDMESALQYDDRRRFLFAFLELEKQVVDLCHSKGIKVEDNSTVSDLLLTMVQEKIMDEETRETIEQASAVQEKLIPTVEDVNYDVYEIAAMLIEITSNLKEMAEGKS
jgi:hypothetical protein